MVLFTEKVFEMDDVLVKFGLVLQREGNVLISLLEVKEIPTIANIRLHVEHVIGTMRKIYVVFYNEPETNEIVTLICSCHNFFSLSSVQILFILACCLLYVL